MGRTHTYNDFWINLGEAGEHEIQIEWIDMSFPGEPVRVVIKKATVFVRFQPDEKPQLLDVTPAVINSDLWKDRIRKDYNASLTRDWDSDPDFSYFEGA